MKFFLILISILTSFSGYAQNKQVMVDTFYAVNGFTAIRLLLNSDNSFFIAESNCAEASIARGKWKSKNSNIELLPCDRDSNFVKPEIIFTHPGSDETLLVLQIIDCFNRPVCNYSIIFFDSSGRAFDYYADSNGLLKVNRNRFTSFFTGNEMIEFDFQNNLDNYLHPLTNNNPGVIIRLNYPKEILTERPIVRSFEFNGAEFIKKRKGLQYKHSKITLARL